MDSVHSNIFIKAVEHGDISLMKYLLINPMAKIDPTLWNNYALRKASENGYSEIVRLLLSDSRVDPSFWDNYVLRSAFKNGHLDVVLLLLNDSRVINGNQEALDHPKIQEILKENQAVKTAILWNCGTVRGAWKDLGLMIAEKVSI